MTIMIRAPYSKEDLPGSYCPTVDGDVCEQLIALGVGDQRAACSLEDLFKVEPDHNTPSRDWTIALASSSTSENGSTFFPVI